MAVMGVLSLALVLIPFLPGIRDIPRWIPIYRIIWRDHYRTHDQQAAEPLHGAPEGAATGAQSAVRRSPPSAAAVNLRRGARRGLDPQPW